MAYKTKARQPKGGVFFNHIHSMKRLSNFYDKLHEALDFNKEAYLEFRSSKSEIITGKIDNKGTMRITMVSGNFEETLQIFPDSVKRLRSMTQSKSNYNLLYNLGNILNSSSWSSQPMNKFQDFLEKHKLQYKHSYYGLYHD